MSLRLGAIASLVAFAASCGHASNQGAGGIEPGGGSCRRVRPAVVVSLDVDGAAHRAHAGRHPPNRLCEGSVGRLLRRQVAHLRDHGEHVGELEPDLRASPTGPAAAASAQPYYLDNNPNLRGYHAAPQVFYFAPQAKWYLVFQSGQPQYSTTNDITKPETWSAPSNFFASDPPGLTAHKGAGGWLDFFVDLRRRPLPSLLHG